MKTEGKCSLILSIFICFYIMWYGRQLKLRRNTLTAVTPFLNYLEKKKSKQHILGGYFLLRSLPGCQRQALHQDYLSLQHKTTLEEVMPYAVLIALEDDTSIYVNDKKYEIPKGAAFIFRGDVQHSGSEYACDNIRFHLYIDVKSRHECRNGADLRWKPT